MLSSTGYIWRVRYLGREEGEAQRNGPGSRAQSCEQEEKREEAGDGNEEGVSGNTGKDRVTGWDRT